MRGCDEVLVVTWGHDKVVASGVGGDTLRCVGSVGIVCYDSLSICKEG